MGGRSPRSREKAADAAEARAIRKLRRDEAGGRYPRALAVRALRAKRAILLDVSLTGPPQTHAVWLAPSGDVPHDPRVLPWPLPSQCAHTAVVPHVLEYLDPATWDAWWTELHRVLRPKGRVYISGPYGGDLSVAWFDDPRHRMRITGEGLRHLDVRARTPEEQTRPLPPWHVVSFTRLPVGGGRIHYNAILEAVAA